MGTRHLTAVYVDGEYRVAQYGQWDGYPECTGVQCLEFARELANRDVRDEFTAKVRAARWITDQEYDAIDARIKRGELIQWSRVYPELSRDTGSDILGMILDRPAGMALKNSLSFAANSLFCEWAYVIDLDAGTYEVFEGFNEEPLTEDDRFWFLRHYESPRNKYHGVKLRAKWRFDDLPDDQAFLDAFGTEEGEE